MQKEMIEWIANTFSKKHSGNDRKRLLMDLKHNPEFVVEVVRKNVPLLAEEWSKEFGRAAIHVTNDTGTPDAFDALARRVFGHLHISLQEELSGVSE
ncbi:MAG: hypothetical protein UV60_C0006G0023 [Parcubacteria group bacterium GW2011_GWA2_43_11]|nr:MAG: hypothetical protein UU89_C0005G0024 [Parcubacteria group bacterium GW2011_GWC2_42_11]KKS85671.1 MAG: hypothetical protein UV60_C0006G0023 [Parcubacteria group bacterium GW2011_GWA2_43_11]